MCRLLALGNFGRLGGTTVSPDLGQFLAQSHLGNVVRGCRHGQEVSQRISTNGASDSWRKLQQFSACLAEFPELINYFHIAKMPLKLLIFHCVPGWAILCSGPSQYPLLQIATEDGVTMNNISPSFLSFPI